MNGFEREVRERILSLTSHATHQCARAAARRLAGRRGARSRDNPAVLGAAPYIEDQALLIAGDKSSGAVVTGVLPEDERKVTVDRGQSARRARSTPDAPASSASCSATSSRRRSACSSGDRVVIVTSLRTVTPAGVMPRMRGFKVVGIFQRRHVRVRSQSRLRSHRRRRAPVSHGRRRDRLAAEAHRHVRGAARGARAGRCRSAAAITSTTGRASTRTSSARSS